MANQEPPSPNDRTRARLHEELDKFLDEVLRAKPSLANGECGKLLLDVGLTEELIDGLIEVSFCRTGL